MLPFIELFYGTLYISININKLEISKCVFDSIDNIMKIDSFSF